MNFNGEMHVFFVNKEIIVEKRAIIEIKNEMEMKLKENPNDLYSITVLEQILYQYDLDYKQALKVIKHGLELDPQNIDFRLDIVDIMILFEQGQVNVYQKLLEESFSLDPKYWRYYYVSGNVFTDQEDDFGQRNILMEGLKIHPSNSFIKSHLAQTYAEYNTLRECAAQLVREIDLNQYYNYELLRRLAYCLRLLEDERSEGFSEKAIELNPKSIKSICNLAQLQRINKKDYQKSVDLCTYALSLFPSYTLAFFNLGRGYQMLEDERYIDNYKKCLGTRKYNEVLETLALYNFKNDQDEEALYYIRRYLRLQKDSDEYSLYLYSLLLDYIILDSEEAEVNMSKLLNLSYIKLTCQTQPYEEMQFYNEKINELLEKVDQEDE